MSLQNRMGGKSSARRTSSADRRAKTLGSQDKKMRMLETWSRVPELGEGLDKLPLQEALNTAVNLDRQASYLSNLNESQISTSFSGFTPENMLRIVRHSMPNLCRSKIFTEFAMETAKDSFKYIRPVYSPNGQMENPTKDSNDGPSSLRDKFTNPDEALTDYEGNSVNGEKFRKSIYEQTEDLYSQEFFPVTADATGIITFGHATGDTTKSPYGLNSKNLIGGYGTVYIGNEQNLIAKEDKQTGLWVVNQDAVAILESAGIIADADIADGKKVFIKFTPASSNACATLEVVYGADATGTALVGTDEAPIKAFMRYDSEVDIAGDYLGEVQITMSEYEFKPRPTAIGVSWTQLTEINMDYSFQVSAEEFLLTYASQEIRVALDYRAIRTAYNEAKTNPKAYHAVFDAGYNTANGTTAGTKEGYIHNAQTFSSAIDVIGDTMLCDINRGGVARIVAGASVASYMKLMGGFSNKGEMAKLGVHQIGELDGVPVFKVPSSIIPANEVLTVWKNEAQEGDVSIAFGTLIPFFSTGVIARKNFYKEAGLATYGDWSVINKRYLGLIKVKNLKDMVNVEALNNIKIYGNDEA